MAELDAALFKLINTGMGRPWLDPVMLAFTWMGLGIAQAGLCVGLCLCGWIWENVSWRRAGYAGLTAFALSGIAVQIGKHTWDRPRPLLALFDVRIVDEPLFVHSFPSGHTTTAFAVLFACSIFLPRMRYFLITLAFATGLSRVYLGVHFPLDVIYGGLVGALIGIWSAGIVKRRGTTKPTVNDQIQTA